MGIWVFHMISLLFRFRIAAFAIECVADGVHDGEIFGRVFKHLGVALSTFDIGVLSRFFENLRELIVFENLSVGRTGELAEFVIFEQALQQISDDYPVRFRKVALILLVDRLNNLVKQALFRFNRQSCRLDFGRRQKGG